MYLKFFILLLFLAFNIAEGEAPLPDPQRYPHEGGGDPQGACLTSAINP